MKRLALLLLITAHLHAQVTVTGGATITAGGGGGGGGGVGAGAAYQVPQYPAAGTQLGPTPGLYSLNPNMSIAQINALFSGLTAGQNTVLIPDGTATINGGPNIGYVPQTFVNTNNVTTHSFKLGDDYVQMTTYGIACDAKQLNGLTITQGSNLVSVGSDFGPEGIGKIMTFGYQTGPKYTDPQLSWVAKIVGYTFPNAVLSAPAPFNYIGGAVQYGTDNFAALSMAMTVNGSSRPMSIPSGCSMLTSKPVPWSNSQTIVGRSIGSSGFTGVPGTDVISTVDAPGNGVNTAGTTLSNFSMVVDVRVDPSQVSGGPWTSYDANGNPTLHQATYRPLNILSSRANNPLGPGWVTSGTNGVAATNAGSAVICIPNQYAPPPVGQTVIFPYFTTTFSATVSSTAGSCPAGNQARTLSVNVPAGGTLAQAEWFAGTAFQSTTTTIPTTMSYPLTIALTLPNQLSQGQVTNFATHGHVKICGSEFDYMGGTVSSTTGMSMILQRGPATTAGCTGTTVVAPLNYCPAANTFGNTSDMPWPVIPTINTGDSTPVGANFYAGDCVGNAGIAFPQANGNVYSGPGLAGGFLENLGFSPFGPGNQHGGAAIYSAGNATPFGTDIGGIRTAGMQFGFVEGPASSGNHGVASNGPTGEGNTIHDSTIFAAEPLALTNFQGSTIEVINSNSTEYNPVDGSPIGPGTCLMLNGTVDEQNGNGASTVADDTITNFQCEPEVPAGSTTLERPVYAELDTYNSVYQNSNFEGVPTLIGGANNTIKSSQLSIPSINYGVANHVEDVFVGGLQNFTNVYDGTAQIVNWGSNFDCSLREGVGPLQPCTVGTLAVPQGRTIEAAQDGNFDHPYENSLGGVITPGEWDTASNLDSHPMTVQNVQDSTEPYWHAYSGCNLGSGGQCLVGNFDGFNGPIWVGPHQRVADTAYRAEINYKNATVSSSVSISISAFDSGSGTCPSGGTVANQVVSATTTWQHISIPADFTGKAGCALNIQFYNGTAVDQFRIGEFDMVPLAQKPVSQNYNLLNALLLNGVAGTTGQIPVVQASGALGWGTGGGGGGMVYPGAGVAVSSGTAWLTSLQTGTANGNLVVLGSTGLPAVSGVNLTSLAASALSGTATVNTTGTAANLSGTPALPNGTTATTQTTGDNTTKIATDQFVLTNALTNPMTALGQVIYGGTSGAATALNGVTATQPGFLSSTGNGTTAAAPAWKTSSGSGNVALTTSPQFTTPNIGVASGTSVAVTGTSGSTGVYGTGTAIMTGGTGSVVGTGGSYVAPACLSTSPATNCDSFGGVATITTGAGTLAPGTVLTVTFPGTRTYTPSCPVSMKNGSGDTAAHQPYMAMSNASGTVTGTLTVDIALVPNTTYLFTYGVCDGQ